MSDVTLPDLEWTLAAMEAAGGALASLSAACRALFASGRWRMAAVPLARIAHAQDPVWTLPSDYDGLAVPAVHSSLVIFKGDLNYRKLLGDRAWPPTTPLAAAAAALPAAWVALRTLKSPVAAGLPAAAVERAAVDPQWMTSGDYAVIQFLPCPTL